MVLTEVAFLPLHVDVVPCCFMALEITLLFGLEVASWKVAFLPDHVDVVLCCFMSLEMALNNNGLILATNYLHHKLQRNMANFTCIKAYLKKYN